MTRCRHCQEEMATEHVVCLACGKSQLPALGEPPPETGEADETAIQDAGAGGPRERDDREPRPPTRPAVIHHVLPDGEERTVRLTAGRARIGREEGSPEEFHLPGDPLLSPVHAEFRYRGDRLLVVDLDSLNGVFHRIREPALLRDGQRLFLAGQVFRFELVDRAPAAPPPPPDGTIAFGCGDLPTRARLVAVLRDGSDGPALHLTGERQVIGRERGNFLFPRDESMSRRHAAIERKGSGFRISDLGSTNGVFVRVGERELEPGDVLRIGGQQLRVDYP